MFLFELILGLLLLNLSIFLFFLCHNLCWNLLCCSLIFWSLCAANFTIFIWCHVFRVAFRALPFSLRSLIEPLFNLWGILFVSCLDFIYLVLSQLKVGKIDQSAINRVSICIYLNALFANDPTWRVSWLYLPSVLYILPTTVVLPAFDMVGHLACTPRDVKPGIIDLYFWQPVVDLNHLRI